MNLIRFALLLIGCSLGTQAATAVDFVRDIEPIFAAHCLDCHGPDEQSSEFRLDRRAVMLHGGGSGEPVVVPADPAASFLLKVIRHKEPGLEMPPDGSLTDEEIGLIEEWIKGGALTPDEYGPDTAEVELTHWSFRPVVRPTTADDLDGFILRKLAEQGLQPSPEAERRVLIRRLYLVMLGLPPAPEEVDAFLRDASDTAWPELVERALASPRYGERWASHWLDLVRFGETHGFETNRERPNAWPYRDWVIASLNDDKPYDEFVREQIAGDALGVDVGTGFLVAGPYDQVQGSDRKLRLMQRMNELDDVINTTGTAFLGLTTGCARCHNHKFDPISQRDYYALQAVFAGVRHGERPLPPRAEQQQQLDAIDAEIAELATRLRKFRTGTSGPSGNVASSEVATQDAVRPAVNAKQNVDVSPVRETRSVRLTIAESINGEACIDELEIYAGDQNVALASLGAVPSVSGSFVHPKHKLEHINDGQYGNSRSWIVDSVEGGWVQIDLPTPVRINRIVWGRDRHGEFTDRLITGYQIDVATASGAWETVATSADRLPPQTMTPEEAGYRFTDFSPEEAEQGRAWLRDLTELRERKSAIETSLLVYAGTFEQPEATHRLYRGEPDAPREQVAPDAIAAFTSLELDTETPEQERRLALADWIASRENPLTARVIVNRLWQFHFGTGLVDTPSDFGLNGTPPSHPELLDWLACELMDHGWSLKHIHRLILNSSTWRQGDRPQADAVAIDAGSRLLWRFPPRRLEAEAIRDSILAVSGVLDEENSGGPGFSAFDVEMENVRHYHPKRDFGPDDWRRMIYMTKVRQEKDQVFGAFDCPDASMVVSQRSRSTTPLQALNLLNSRFVMQQAELFAERLKEEHLTVEEQIVRAWQLCFQREPTSDETADSLRFVHDEELEQFTRAMLNTNEFVLIP